MKSVSWRASMVTVVLCAGSAAGALTTSKAPVIVAAGDIACNPRNSGATGASNDNEAACHMNATAALVARVHPDAVLPLGDLQYSHDDLYGFQRGYDKTWGRFKNISHPVVGNHEYDDSDARGYFAYWGTRAGPPGKGWYSYKLGSWHLIALNGECSGPSVGGCGKESAQWRWLRTDLQAHPRGCRLAYWHQPRFSTGPHGNNSDYGDFWELLYAAHVDVILNGHDHDYERFASLNPQQKSDSEGIREFVVGTGGKDHSPFFYPVNSSITRQNVSFGVLSMTLYDNRYTWRYIAELGASYNDSGSADCHRILNPSSM